LAITSKLLSLGHRFFLPALVVFGSLLVFRNLLQSIVCHVKKQAKQFDQLFCFENVEAGADKQTM